VRHVSDSEEDDEHFFLALDEEPGNRSVVFEEDGRSCYVYLLESGKIVSSVWLYNCPGQPDDQTSVVATAPRESARVVRSRDPGWSRLVAIESPLGKRLSDAPTD
jgi:hypothetical protein